MDGLLQVNSVSQPMSTAEASRQPLGALSRNRVTSGVGQRKRSAGARRHSGRRGSDSTAAESQHIARVRASRSAGNIGMDSLYQPQKEKLLSSAALYGGQLGQSASATELGGFGFEQATVGAKSARTGARQASAPRERLAARRAGARAGTGNNKSSRVVTAVQGLDQASKQALLDVIKMERQSRSAQQHKEEAVDAMHAEASRNCSSDDAEQQAFEAIAMIESTELEHQVMAGGAILRFCASAPEPCPAMMARVATVYGRLQQTAAGAATERAAAVKAETAKWEAKDAGAERRQKEAMSKLGATMGSEMKDMKLQLETVTAERDAAQAKAAELTAKAAVRAKKLEKSSAKLSSEASTTPTAAGKPADASAAAETSKEVSILKAAVVASDREMKEMKTRVKKMLAKSKKDVTASDELTEALSHARAQLGALMEENESLKSSASNDAIFKASEDLSDHAAKLKDLEIAATRGQNQLNIERGTGEADMSALPEGTMITEIALEQAAASPTAGDSVFGGLDMGDISRCSPVDLNRSQALDGMFAESDASPIAATEATILNEDASFFVDEGADAASTFDGAEVVELRHEVGQLRIRNAELEEELDRALDAAYDSEEDNAPISAAKKPMANSGLPPMDRPSDIPALDFLNLEVKLKELDAAVSIFPPVSFIFLRYPSIFYSISSTFLHLPSIFAPIVFNFPFNCQEAVAEAAEKAAKGESTG